MEEINFSPVLTARNFGINSIKLDNISIQDTLKEFKNIKIEKNNAIVDKDNSNKKLTYGIDEKFEENIYKNANSKLRIKTGNNDQIKIIYDFDDENLQLISNIEIIANSNADVIIEYKSNTDKPCLHNGIIRTIANENANIRITVVNLLNNLSDNFESIENELYDNSNVEYTIVDFGGKNSVSNYYTNIIGNNSDNVLKTIYLGAKDELKDLNYIVELRGKKSNVDIDVQGALKDNSKKNFKGTIDFKQGCKKSKGNENEYCMLLSNEAKAIALPMLLCTEHEVEGNHSTASGKVDKSALFYLMSRGISYTEAIKLIVKARFNKIIDAIKDENVKDEILEEIDKILN